MNKRTIRFETRPSKVRKLSMGAIQLILSGLDRLVASPPFDGSEVSLGESERIPSLGIALPDDPEFRRVMMETIREPEDVEGARRILGWQPSDGTNRSSDPET